jgi:peptide/nickel transport system permease protein
MSNPTYFFIPSTALILVVLTFNLLGDAVRDALDPRSEIG